jgi:hypothetical protein
VKPPEATVRTAVSVPLRFVDGYVTSARVVSFHGLVDGREHLAVGLGRDNDVPLVRPHSECLTGDVLGSQRCDCGAQLRESVELIAERGGYLLYLRQEGRGIGLYEKRARHRGYRARRDRCAPVSRQRQLPCGQGPTRRAPVRRAGVGVDQASRSSCVMMVVDEATVVYRLARNNRVATVRLGETVDIAPRSKDDRPVGHPVVSALPEWES